MIRLTHRLQTRIARHLLVLLAGMWSLAFVAPCVMADPVCPEMESPCANMALQQDEASPCETLQAVDCRLQATDATTDHAPASLDPGAPLARLQHAPIPPDALRNPRRNRWVDVAQQPTPTPLYLRHATLLM